MAQLATAKLALRFDQREGRTRMFVDAQQPPWRVIRAFPGTDGSSLAHLHNVSGGVLAGDRLALCIDVGPNCAAQVTSTSATRLYRHRNGSQESQQDIQIQVGEDALLEYLPDALIPFAGARYSQQTSITLGSNSTLIWWETLAPGRQAMGEAFAFERLHIRSELRSPLRPLLLENFELKPGQRSMASAARFGPYTHMTNFYACKVGLPAAAWRELERMLNEFCGGQSRSGATIWGATTLVADGVAVRGLSVSAREIPATLIDCWRIVRRFLTGTEAEPPRKVY